MNVRSRMTKPQNPGSVSVTTTMSTGPHASEATAMSSGHESVHSTISLAGTLVNSGAVVSCTVMVCVAEALFPASSVAVKVRMIK